MYDDETQSIIVEGNDGYQKAKNYMKLMMPKQLKKVKKYRDKMPLFFKENIEKKLFEIFKTEVKLSSGGYLVINPTEALVSIDINSGKSIKQKKRQRLQAMGLLMLLLMQLKKLPKISPQQKECLDFFRVMLGLVKLL